METIIALVTLVIVCLVCLIIGLVLGLKIPSWLGARTNPQSAIRNPQFPPLTRGDYRAALCVDEKEIWWRAVHEAIATQREAAFAEIMDVTNQKAPELLHYYAGHAQGLDTLQEFLRAERAAGLKGADEE